MTRCVEVLTRITGDATKPRGADDLDLSPGG